MVKSIWDLTAGRPKFKPLEGELKTHDLIIGGGIAGIQTALDIADAGFHCISAIVQRNRIDVLQHAGSGITVDRSYDRVGNQNADTGNFFHGSNLLVVTLGQTISCENASAY